jgi:hypothetical protein
LPEEAEGKVSLLVFTFSREAGQAARACTEAMARPEIRARGISEYRILVLGGLPRFLRKIVVAGIEKGMPASLRDATVKLFTDEEPWKARLGVRSDDDPHLVLVDGEGAVRWLYSGPCDDTGVRLLLEQSTGLAPPAAEAAR